MHGQCFIPLPQGTIVIYSRILCHRIVLKKNKIYYFQDITRHDETLDFIKPLFTMGQASGRSSLLKESKILNMKQNEIMEQFRSEQGLCNLLIATSVLEEGIDIPVCNVIIRFDKIRTYCDYVQTKGK